MVTFSFPLRDLDKPPQHKNGGFTMIELIISVLIIGILSIIMSPIYQSLVTSQKNVYTQKQMIHHQMIATAFLNYAHESTPLGTLPNPYTNTGSRMFSTIYNPADTSTLGIALSSALTQTGITPNFINTDGYESKRERVYQVVTGLVMPIPLYFQTGPLLNLEYQYGAIYQTACPQVDTTCNPTVAPFIPGPSPQMTATNYKTWTTTGTDSDPYFVSSLPLQKSMLSTTSYRMDKIRDSFINFFRANQITAASSDTTNWFPSGTPALSGANAATNQGCKDGWYNLLTNTSILPMIGLSQTEFGITAWGGVIEYCRDYDPTNTKIANAPPHYGAIRIHNNVSKGITPDVVVLSNNAVLTF